jgi:hypothetical protein
MKALMQSFHYNGRNAARKTTAEIGVYIQANHYVFEAKVVCIFEAKVVCIFVAKLLCILAKQCVGKGGPILSTSITNAA